MTTLALEIYPEQHYSEWTPPNQESFTADLKAHLDTHFPGWKTVYYWTLFQPQGIVFSSANQPTRKEENNGA